MDSTKIRDYYNRVYHFEQDARLLDFKRMENFLSGFKIKPGSKYLDVGCGVGLALAVGKIKGAECYGTDLSFTALTMAKKLMSQEVNLVLSEGERLPFKSQKFGYVSVIGSLEHFKNPKAGLEEIRRVCSPGAHVCLVVPNSYGILNKLKLYQGTEQLQEMLATLKEWTKYIERGGFKIIFIESDRGPDIFKDKKPHKILERFLLRFTKCLPLSFAYQFIFICEKKSRVRLNKPSS